MTVETLWILPGGAGGRQRDENGDWQDGPTSTDETLVATPTGNRGWPLEVLNLEPRSAGDVEQIGRDGFTDGFVVYAPLGRVPAPADRVECRGAVYDIVGRPGEWRNGFAPGLFDGLQFTIERGVG